MSKTIVVCGYGSGISDAVAKKFGAEGFAVALVSRTQSKLDAGAAALEKAGVKAAGFATDLTDANAVKKMIAQASEKLGPVAVVHWNAYGGGAGDLTKSDASELRAAFDVSVVGLVAAVQAALPDFEKQKDQAALLVTGGGLSSYDPNVNAMAVQWNAMGLAVAKAAQHKVTGLLSAKLAERGVYVGEVVVMGMVKGTAFDSGNATLEASSIAEKFWELYRGRSVATVNVS